MAGRGEVCDMGCGPGHVARYLRDVGATEFVMLSVAVHEPGYQNNPMQVLEPEHRING